MVVIQVGSFQRGFFDRWTWRVDAKRFTASRRAVAGACAQLFGSLIYIAVIVYDLEKLRKCTDDVTMPGNEKFAICGLNSAIRNSQLFAS